MENVVNDKKFTNILSMIVDKKNGTNISEKSPFFINIGYLAQVSHKVLK